LVTNATMEVINQINSQALFEQLYANVVASWEAIAICAGCALVLCFIWLVLMRFFAGITVWFTILSGLFFLAGLSALLFLTGTELQATWEALPPNAQLQSEEFNWRFILYTSYVL